MSSVPTVVNTCKQHQNEINLNLETETDNIAVSIEKEQVSSWNKSGLSLYMQHKIHSVDYVR